MDINVRTRKVNVGSLRISETFTYKKHLHLVYGIDGTDVVQFLNLSTSSKVGFSPLTKVTPINVSIVRKK